MLPFWTTGYFFVFLLLYQWNKARHLWDIRTFSRDLEKKWRYLEKKNQEFPETYLADISWYLYAAVVAGIYQKREKWQIFVVSKLHISSILLWSERTYSPRPLTLLFAPLIQLWKQYWEEEPSKAQQNQTTAWDNEITFKYFALEKKTPCCLCS